MNAQFHSVLGLDGTSIAVQHLARATKVIWRIRELGTIVAHVDDSLRVPAVERCFHTLWDFSKAANDLRMSNNVHVVNFRMVQHALAIVASVNGHLHVGTLPRSQVAFHDLKRSSSIANPRKEGALDQTATRVTMAVPCSNRSSVRFHRALSTRASEFQSIIRRHDQRKQTCYGEYFRKMKDSSVELL